jgi:glutathione synthase/RimK-type ligase-like ATP-grasp enzyme
MKKIITLTVSSDIHTEKIKKILHDKYSVDLIELNREEYGKKWLISIVSSKTGIKVYLSVEGHDYSSDEIGAIWLRRNFHFNSNQTSFSPKENYVTSQTAIHVNSSFRLLAENIFCINSPDANWRANSKCVQAYYAQDCGLLLPPTFQGGSPEFLYEFSMESNPGGELCIKPIESTHIKIDENLTLAHYTTIFNRRPLQDLSTVRDCPVTIQKFIEKDYEIRATVVGEKIFAASIDTKNASNDAKLDWRHYDWANTPYYPIELPDEINDKLLSVMKKIGLEYGAFDLIKNLDNEYYFLEVNAQGQWLWVEDMTGLNISEAIADRLWSRI